MKQHVSITKSLAKSTLTLSQSNSSSSSKTTAVKTAVIVSENNEESLATEEASGGTSTQMKEQTLEPTIPLQKKITSFFKKKQEKLGGEEVALLGSNQVIYDEQKDLIIEILDKGQAQGREDEGHFDNLVEFSSLTFDALTSQRYAEPSAEQPQRFLNEFGFMEVSPDEEKEALEEVDGPADEEQDQYADVDVDRVNIISDELIQPGCLDANDDELFDDVQPLKRSIKHSLSYSKQYKVMVSLHTFRQFKTEFTVDPRQTSMLDYLTDTIRDGSMIRQLVNENKELQRELREGQLSPKVFEPNFFQQLLEIDRKRQSQKKLKFSEVILDIALYYFLIGGRRLYQTLVANMLFPSLSVVYRHLYAKKTTPEAEFNFNELPTRLEASKSVSYVWISEDDTKVKPGMKYDQHRNLVVGLCLPIDTDKGIPQSGFFEFTSIEAVKTYMDNNLEATYVKLIALKPLNLKSPSIIVALYGTNGSDQWESTTKRWNFVKTELSKVGIIAVGM